MHGAVDLAGVFAKQKHSLASPLMIYYSLFLPPSFAMTNATALGR